MKYLYGCLFGIILSIAVLVTHAKLSQTSHEKCLLKQKEKYTLTIGHNPDMKEICVIFSEHNRIIISFKSNEKFVFYRDLIKNLSSDEL